MKLRSLLLLALLGGPLPPNTRADTETQAPQLIHSVAPEYPAALRAGGFHGQVIVKFGLDDKGTVLNPTVLKPGNPDMDALAVAAVRKWVFSPAMKDGHAVAVRQMRVPITFELNLAIFEGAPDFYAALKQAEAAHKIVLIDFYTTWCEPCKKMDQETWQDLSVANLVRSKAVALKVDAEQQVELAARYHVIAYPTIALIRPDGTLLDTLVGFRDSLTFRQEFTAILGGRSTLDQANDAVKAAGTDPDPLAKARLELGQAKERSGDYAGALVEFLWCFDTGMRPPSSYTGVRLSFLLSDIGALAHDYPPALDALRSRRDAAAKSLEADERSVQDYVALNRVLGEETTSLAALDHLPAASPARAWMARWLFDQLLEARRYQEAAAGFPAPEFETRFSGIAGQAASNPQMHAYLVHFATKELEALAGSGQLVDAKAVLRLLTDFDPSDDTRGEISDSLTRAGHPELIPAAPAAAPATTPPDADKGP